MLATLKGRQSLDSQTDAIIKQKATRLSDRPALTQVGFRVFFSLKTSFDGDAGIQRFCQERAARKGSVN